MEGGEKLEMLSPKGHVLDIALERGKNRKKARERGFSVLYITGLTTWGLGEREGGKRVSACVP